MTPVTEFSIIFISLDEPNADENYYDLLSKCPWAKRSHGVYGSDAAHKAAANLSETSRMITIDADNIVDQEFFGVEIDLTKVQENDIISWAGRNSINSLVYGNGGIKCWPCHVVREMKTHEIADEHDKESQVDFCWKLNYVQMNNVYSTVHNNASPLQAWRAGFREGVKMSLDLGKPIDAAHVKRLHLPNYRRLLIWQSVGSDSRNGLWAILGARQGCQMAILKRDEWDWRNVRDFKWLNQFWDNQVSPIFDDITSEHVCDKTGYSWDNNALKDAIIDIGKDLRKHLDLEIADLDEQGSRFFKKSYVNPPRLNSLARENLLEWLDN